jgi:hypothetical protein
MAGKYITIPMSIVTDNGIPPKAQLLYGLIYSIHRTLNRGQAHPKNKWYAEQLHTNVRQIQIYLRMLREKGYIDIGLYRDINGHIKQRRILPLVLLTKSHV